MIALGLTDYTVPMAQLAQRGMVWTRIITTTNANVPALVDRVREAKNAGLKVVLTVGGIGTDDRQPSFTAALRLIDKLPTVERYTIDNEPDLDGTRACDYRRDWMIARKRLGRRLLWGDLSPHWPLSFTSQAAQCGRLPARLDVAIHPYQLSDPLAPPDKDSPWQQGGIGGLRTVARWLKRNAHVRVRWAITEFGYPTQIGSHSTGMTADRVAWLWPRALRRAEAINALFLIGYVANGPTWRILATP